MTTFPSSPPQARCRTTALVLLPGTSRRATPGKPATLPSGPPTTLSHDVLRVTLADGRHYTITAPFVAADSLRGVEPDHMDRLVSLALSDIWQLEVRRTNAAGTALLVLATASVAAAAILSAQPQPTPPAGTYAGCPLVYSWDGSRWRLDSGTFGGAIAAPLARTDVDLLAHARVERGRLRLRLRTELDETDHTDAIRVVAVDHPPGVTVAPDAAGRLHTVGPLTAPVAAHDFQGRDALTRVRRLGDWSWESVPTGRDSAQLRDIRDGLQLVFPRPAGARQALLVVDGENTPWAPMMLEEFVGWHGRETAAWYDSLDTQPALAEGLAHLITAAGSLTVSVWDGNQWRVGGSIGIAAPEAPRRQVVVLGLAGVPGGSVQVRIEGTPSFWSLDQIAMDYSAPRRLTLHAVALERAVDDRGRQVAAALDAADGRYYVTERGDGAELRFRAPPAVRGMNRSWPRGPADPETHTARRYRAV
jgi:hypothetical protein